MKKGVNLFLSIFLAFVFSSAVFSQVGDSVRVPFKASFRNSFTIPHPLSNDAFKKSFVGIYDFTPSLNMFIYECFYAGLVYKNALLTIPANKVPDVNIKMQVNNVGLKIGGDYYTSEKSFLSYGLNAGQNWTKFTSVVSLIPNNHSDNNHFSSLYVEPEINMNFLVEGNFAIGVDLSCIIINKEFDPYAIFLNEHKGYEPSQLNGLMAYFDFGFNVYYGFWKKQITSQPLFVPTDIEKTEEDN